MPVAGRGAVGIAAGIGHALIGRERGADLDERAAAPHFRVIVAQAAGELPGVVSPARPAQNIHRTKSRRAARGPVDRPAAVRADRERADRGEA